MLEVIIAVDENDGIGKEGKLPWHLPEELGLFKYKTMDSVLIVGRKTSETLPPLYNREIITVSRTGEIDSVEKAIIKAQQSNKRKIFITGGAELYNEVFKNHLHLVSRIHVSFIKGIHNCDVFVTSIPFFRFNCVSHQEFKGFIHEVYEPKYPCGEVQYITLLNDTLISNNYTHGRNGRVISQFGKYLYFNLSKEFPLLTTKKMFLRGVVEELLFFLRGETDSKILEKKGVTIWKPNTEDRGGLMGPMYGYQWRNFGAPYSEMTRSSISDGMDQLNNVVRLIKTEPTSRRIMMTTFNPLQAEEGVLYPCHSIIIQFYVENEFCDITNREVSYLDLYCYNRSNDVGLGLPFNIASTSLLLMIIAKITSLVPRYVNISMGDAHIYVEHVGELSRQIGRIPYSLPRVVIPDISDISDINGLGYGDFILSDYKCHLGLNMDMIA